LIIKELHPKKCDSFFMASLWCQDFSKLKKVKRLVGIASYNIPNPHTPRA
jgi:hypothetical protein